MEELLTSAEAALRLRKPPRTLRQWRYVGRGPKYVKVGASVFYRPSDLQAWIEQQVRDPEADGRACPA